MINTDNNLSTLTPEEFSNYYLNALKNELDIYNLQASKVGFIGFLINLLSNTTYDAKLYKDMLFKEAFPATAQNEDNLYLHASIYGYKAELAKPANAVGEIVFDFSNLPAPSRNIKKRSVVFGLDSGSTGEFLTEISTADNILFSTSASYLFNYESGQYQVVISKQDGTVLSQPSNTSEIKAPFVDFKQESTETINLTLPNYSYNTYYTYNFDVVDQYISEMEVYVNTKDTDSYIKYDVENVKYLKESTDNCVFFTKVSSNSYKIEFGNGIHGTWIPGANVKIIIHKTLGSAGNFNQNNQCVINQPSQAIIYDETYDGKTSSMVIDTINYFTVNFNYSSDGLNPLSGDELRKEIIQYIQTRDNFISESDFYNIIEKYTTDFRVLHKKTKITENIIYILRALRDEYQKPIKTTNIIPEVIKNNSLFSNLHYTIRKEGKLENGQYFYQVYAIDPFGNKVYSGEIGISLLEDNGHSIELYWDKIPAAIKYLIYLRDKNYEYYYETKDNYFLDTGKNDNLILRNELPLPDINTKISVYPEFEYKNNKYISPFLYKYNDIYNMYDGYLFYTDMYINFDYIVQENSSQTNNISSIHPSIYLNIIYNDNQSTSIKLKSYQSLIGWSFKLSIPLLNISNVDMNNDEENTATYVYTKNNGILEENIIISIDCYYNNKLIFTAKTNKINQSINYSDQLQFPIYTLNNINYLIDVPIIEKEKFLNNKNFYLDKIKEFLLGFNFEENRMISDNIGFRFLNTLGCYSFLAFNSFKQEGELFEGYNYLKKYTPISISLTPTKVPTNKDSWIIDTYKTIPIESTVIAENDSDLYSTLLYGGSIFNTNNNVVSLPYKITLNGDYSKDIFPLNVIRIKKSNNGLNGLYRIISVDYNADLNKTFLLTFDKLPVSTNDGVVCIAEYESWKAGGPDNIATWNLETNSWVFTEINNNDVITLFDKSISKTYIYNDDFEYVEYGLTYPLKMNVLIDINKDVVIRYNIDLTQAKEQLRLELARYLQLFLTGTDIKYYPSAIIEFILETRRAWIKHVRIEVFDNDNKKIKDGIETYSEETIRDRLSNSKLDMLNYTSTFVNWDVDNINITYIS